MAMRKGFLGSRREEIIEDLYNQVKALETRYRKLYEGSPDMYRTIDIDGFIVDCNQAYVEKLGYATKSDVIGHLIFEHTAERSVDAMRQSFTEWQLVGQVSNKEVWLKKRDGSEFPALINATSLFDDAGHLVGSNTVITDITEVQASQQRLQEANEALKQAHELREDFIRIAAHDLRNPIQPILMAAEMAKRNPDCQTQALDIIIKEARRLKKLADNFLDVSKIETGAIQYKMDRVLATDILDEIIEEARLSLDGVVALDKRHQRPVTITSLLLHDKTTMLNVDRDKLVQALLNIVNNAIKFTRAGEITIKSRQIADESFEIQISDSGPGIPSEMLPRLFQKFASMITDRDPKNQGTGLGLFISKSIISSHAGAVSANNNPGGKGTTFTVTLPLCNSLSEPTMP
jgi:PAS domain S-box-containing protein